MIFTIADSKQVDIQIGDWVDVDPMYMNPDPQWGYSIEIVDIDSSNQIWANMWNGAVYELSVIDAVCFTKNYRQVPFEE